MELYSADIEMLMARWNTLYLQIKLHNGYSGNRTPFHSQVVIVIFHSLKLCAISSL
jgi:hypothetical protein